MTRRIVAIGLLFLLWTSAALAQSFGEVRYADRPLNVRKARSLDAEHVKTLQPGDRVRVDFLKDGWYAVFDLNATVRDESKALGYANSRFLLPVLQGQAAATPAKGPAVQPTLAEKTPPVAVPEAPAVPAPAGTPATTKAVEAPAKVSVPAKAAAPAVETAPGQTYTVKSEIKSTARAVPLRRARDLKALATGTLAAGDKVQAAFLRDGWYAVFPLSEKDLKESKALGYVHASQLVPETPGIKPLPEPVAASVPAASAAPAPAALGEVKEEASVVPPANPVAPVPGQAPVKINADRMTYAEKDRKVVFSGNVRAEHEGLQLWATTLTAYFAEAGKSKDVAENIERIVADGGVRMKKGSNEGTCQTLTYFVKDGILRMEGNPQLSDGTNKVAGEIIKFYVRDSRSEVLGGQNKRVEAIFFAPEGVKKP